MEQLNGMPRLGLGTWQIEGRAATEAVRDALEMGYRHIDTARMYGNEAEVGAGLREGGVAREEIFLTTKVWPEEHEPARLRRSAEASLRDLGTDYVDLLLLHWPSPDVPLEDSLEAMLELREQGRVRHVGLSNHSPGLLRRALAVAPIFTNQVEFHPFLGQDALLGLAEEHDLVITAYSPLAHGKVMRDATLREVAERVGATPAQVALRWLLDQPRTTVIPKASSPERRRENLAALDVRLSAEDRARIDALPKDQREFDGGYAPDWDS